MATSESDVNIVSKLSMKTIRVNPAKFATDSGAPIALVYGQLTGIKDVVDKVRGDVYHALLGSFEGQNLETGERFRSGVLYLPAGIHDMLSASVAKLPEDDDSAYVEFGLEIRAVKAKNPAGYSYEAKSLLKPKASDPLEQLRALLPTNTVSAKQPALPKAK